METLGSVTVICSDKTGTLTRNEMTVQRVVCADHVFDVSGVGYEPLGDCRLDDRIVDPEHYPALALAIRTGVLCNDAHLQQQAHQWRVMGDPTEGALLVLGGKVGFSQHVADGAWPRLDSIPFESQHRFMASYHQDSDGAPWIFVKGAPERILEMCGSQAGHAGDQPIDRDYWRRMATDTAAKGLRLLALACKRSAPANDQLTFADVEAGYTLLALVGIIDPPREEAIVAVDECHRAGIRVKMITGDHAETARAIGAQLAIGVGKPAVTGAELAMMDDAALRQVAIDVDVFARASPEHKLRLVQALQNDGQVVAMTGDGVNDAPALKRADVGVAMGMKGTEAAKEASDMVLADDNFATIASAVREGRAVYDNLKKFILFMLPTNGGEALVVIAAILFELTLPLTPAQVLWINMVTSSTLGLALAFEPAERGIMARRPRPPGEALLSGFFIWRVLMVSVLMMSGPRPVPLGNEQQRQRRSGAHHGGQCRGDGGDVLPAQQPLDPRLGRQSPGPDGQPLRAAGHRRLHSPATGVHPRADHAVDLRFDRPLAAAMGPGGLRRPAGVLRGGAGEAGDPPFPVGRTDRADHGVLSPRRNRIQAEASCLDSRPLMAPRPVSNWHKQIVHNIKINCLSLWLQIAIVRAS